MLIQRTLGRSKGVTQVNCGRGGRSEDTRGQRHSHAPTIWGGDVGGDVGGGTDGDEIIAPRRQSEWKGGEGIEKATNAFSGMGKHFVYFSDLSQV